MYVFVLDKNLKPLDPCHPARARELLKKGRAAVYRRYPFTIIMTDRTLEESVTHEHRLKLDPGSKTTGIAVVQENTGRVTSAFELTHRGQQIQDALLARRALRRGRRNRKTRYRQPRFLNRTRRAGWLPPSLQSRIENILTWVRRIRKLCPVTAISQELVKFDLQALENPEISGIEYQQGTLFGYEVREYLLQKWDRKCAYCGASEVPLEIEHILAKSKGGTNRISNLTLACHPCNERKGNKPIEKFLAKKPEVLKRIMSQVKTSLKDAAVVNATRWELYRRLQETGLSVETGSGGLTKFNRITRGIEKSHWTDAANVGKSTPEKLLIKSVCPVQVKATGHGSRQMAGTDKYGFPIRHRERTVKHFGFQTGDIVRAVVTSGKKVGTYVGRVLCRKSGSFDIRTASGRVAGISHKYCQGIHRSDGYTYGKLSVNVPSRDVD